MTLPKVNSKKYDELKLTSRHCWRGTFRHCCLGTDWQSWDCSCTGTCWQLCFGTCWQLCRGTWRMKWSMRNTNIPQITLTVAYLLAILLGDLLTILTWHSLAALSLDWIALLARNCLTLLFRHLLAFLSLHLKSIAVNFGWCFLNVVLSRGYTIFLKEST